MKKIITYIYFFIVFILITVLELVPNHRVGYSDYDLWLVFGLFPLIFFCRWVELTAKKIKKIRHIKYTMLLITKQ